MASWGSIRRSVMRLSSVSVSEPPRLPSVSQSAPDQLLQDARIPASAVQLVVLGVVSHGAGDSLQQRGWSGDACLPVVEEWQAAVD